MFRARRAIWNELRLRSSILPSTILSWRSAQWNTASILLIILSSISSWNMTAFGTLRVLRAIQISTWVISWVSISILILRQYSITKTMRLRHFYSWCCLVIPWYFTANSDVSMPTTLPLFSAITTSSWSWSIIIIRPYFRWLTIMNRRVCGMCLICRMLLVRRSSIRVCVNDLVRRQIVWFIEITYV